VAETLARLAQGLAVNPQAMSRNLAMTRGLIASEAVMMRLTRRMGRHEAHRLLYAAAQRSQSEGVPFIDAIRAQPPFNGGALPDDLLQALDAQAYVGESARLVVDTVARVAPGCVEP
jgi:adenylosuccinate lyase/3-carboxy-cis,cis-muconate cycloisomerase